MTEARICLLIGLIWQTSTPWQYKKLQNCDHAWLNSDACCLRWLWISDCQPLKQSTPDTSSQSWTGKRLPPWLRFYNWTTPTRPRKLWLWRLGMFIVHWSNSIAFAFSVFTQSGLLYKCRDSRFFYTSELYPQSVDFSDLNCSQKSQLLPHRRHLIYKFYYFVRRID